MRCAKQEVSVSPSTPEQEFLLNTSNFSIVFLTGNRAPALVRRCCERRRRNNEFPPQRNPTPAEMAIQNSIRRMMEEGVLMPGGGTFPSGPSVGGMSPEDRRDYVANVLRTKVRLDISPVFLLVCV